MKYLCLAYYNEAAFETLTPSELEALGQACQPHDDALRQSGKLGTVASLRHREAVTVRSRSGRISVTDGPFVESKEQVGSFFLIEARDLEEAIQVASLHPAARLGEHLGWGLEIRPVETFVP
ncbi:YciI family protein [Myxococcus stipitatus]|uniref:YciI family protein n=1 Tax=Myxococcus stipitatus TaxID=83455 RepID=UPI003144E861